MNASVPSFMIDVAAHQPAQQLEQPAAIARARPFVAGVFDDMEFAEYRAVEALSQSGARKILRSPLHYKLDRDQPADSTAAMNFGQAVHCGVLEPNAFTARVCASPKVDKRTKEGKAAWADFEFCNDGKLILSQDDFDRARRCIDAVLGHPSASRLLDGARRELSLFWNDGEYGVRCKARLDLLNGALLGDLKTCTDASAEAFAKSIASYGYALQAAHYFSGCEHVLNATPDAFAFIAVESEPPHAVATYFLGTTSMRVGARLMDEAMSRYKAAIESGRWPGYPERIEVIELPRWARRFEA